MSRNICRAGALLTVCSLFPLTLAWAANAPTQGTMFYTTFNGGQNVHRVDYSFDGTTFSLSANMAIGPGVPGADGIVFTSDHNLAIGGQGTHVNKVDPATGALLGSPGSDGTQAYHMMVGPDGRIWSSGIPGTPAYYNSTLTANGTSVPIIGNEGVDSLAWTGADPNKAFYTSSGAGGFGSLGTIDLSTGVETHLLGGIPAAHGMTYDPFTSSLILFGDGHITQIDPTTLATIADITPAGFSSSFDQGTVDGKGHVFAANNDGQMYFIDYSASGKIDTAGFTSRDFLAASLDDIAPLVGQGSNNAPEALNTVVSLALSCFGLLAFKRRSLRS